MNHVMIDIETMGVKPTAPIVSIGACYFDPLTGKIGNTFKVLVNWQDPGLGCERVFEPRTVQWWMRQSAEAQGSILGIPDEELDDALMQLSSFLIDMEFLWCTGMLVDIGILENAYDQINIECSWNYRQLRDGRTMIDLAQRLEVPKPKRVGIPHDPLCDAIWQVAGVSAVWQRLFLKDL